MDKFQREKSTTAQRLQQAENDRRVNGTEQSDIDKQIKTIDSDRVVMVHKLGTQQDLYDERGESIQKLCNQLGIAVLGDLQNSNERQNELMISIAEKLVSKEKNVSEMTESNECKDVEQQSIIDALRTKLSSAETELSSQQKQLHQTRLARSQFYAKIKESESSERDTEETKNQQEMVTEIIRKMESQFNATGVKTTLVENKEKAIGLRVTLTELDGNIQLLNMVSVAMNEINEKESQREYYQ